MEQHSLSHFLAMALQPIFGGTIPITLIKCNKNVKIAVFLPDIEFPESLHLELDLKTALDQAKDILIVVPSHAFGEILLKIRPHLKPDHRLIWATKGLERNTGRLLQEVVEETLGKAIPIRSAFRSHFCERIGSRFANSDYPCLS